MCINKNDLLIILKKANIIDVNEITMKECDSTVSNVYEIVRSNHVNLIIKVFNKKFSRIQVKTSITLQIFLSTYNLAPKVIKIQSKNWIYYKKNHIFLMEKAEMANYENSVDEIYEHGKLLGKVHIKLKDFHFMRKSRYLRCRNYFYNAVTFGFLRLIYRNKNPKYFEYIKFQSYLLKDYKRYKSKYKKKYLDYQYVHGDYRKANILHYNLNYCVIDLDQISYFPKTYEIFKYIFSEIGEVLSLEQFEMNFKAFICGYNQMGSLKMLELVHGFSFYYYTYISDYRSYLKVHMLKYNDEYLANRMKFCQWYFNNYDQFIKIIKSYDR